MPILMVMHWPEVTVDLYEQMRKTVNWEGNVPKGAISHASAFKNGLHVVDLWENVEDFNSFVEQRLMPEVQKTDVKTQPKVDIYPVHAIFTPGFNHK